MEEVRTILELYASVSISADCLVKSEGEISITFVWYYATLR